jgi:hypothetical protein
VELLKAMKTKSVTRPRMSGTAIGHQNPAICLVRFAGRVRGSRLRCQIQVRSPGSRRTGSITSQP